MKTEIQYLKGNQTWAIMPLRLISLLDANGYIKLSTKHMEVLICIRNVW